MYIPAPVYAPASASMESDLAPPGAGLPPTSVMRPTSMTTPTNYMPQYAGYVGADRLSTPRDSVIAPSLSPGAESANQDHRAQSLLSQQARVREEMARLQRLQELADMDAALERRLMEG
jgi:hypothetical protein